VPHRFSAVFTEKTSQLLRSLQRAGTSKMAHRPTLLAVLACVVAASAAPAVVSAAASFVPKGRYGHCTFVVGGKMYLLGGAPFNSTSLSDELVAFDPTTKEWTRLNTAATGDAPPGIEGQTCTPHTHLPLVYVTGGNMANAAAPKGDVTNKTYVLDLSSSAAPKWKAGPPLTAAVRRHTAVLSGSELVLMGGSHGPSCQENLTDAVSVATLTATGGLSDWAERATSGSGPAPRMGHVAVLQPKTQRMYVVAGQTSNNCSAEGYQNDAYVLDLNTYAWAPVTATGSAPRKRYGPSGWWNALSGGVQITGGTCGEACGACGHANDTFTLALSGSKPDAGKWEPTNAQGRGPPPRDRHCSVLLTEDTVVDWGGFVDSHTVPPTWPTDVFALSLGAKPEWTDLSH
jgi:hypothetical protein